MTLESLALQVSTESAALAECAGRKERPARTVRKVFLVHLDWSETLDQRENPVPLDSLDRLVCPDLLVSRYLKSYSEKNC